MYSNSINNMEQFRYIFGELEDKRIQSSGAPVSLEVIKP